MFFLTRYFKVDTYIFMQSVQGFITDFFFGGEKKRKP